MNTDSLKNEFSSHFARSAAAVAAAPGRVNLIGEHTDYNDGFVLPIAIERRTLAAWARREDAKLRLASMQQPGHDVEIDLSAPLEPAEPRWANYPVGVAAGLIERGLELPGCDVLFDSDVPIGSGLSSSASLEVAMAVAMLAACGATVPPDELARLCRRAENEFAGAPCGIMDQAISIMARPGCAMLLDCRSGQTTHIPFDFKKISTVLLVVDTQVTHDLSDGGYPARRRQCTQAATALGVRALRDAGLEQIESATADGTLSEKQSARARHVAGEIQRTQRAAEALRAGNPKAFGELMYASHASLRDDFEVSCDELDAIVDLARQCEGVWGARMTGGGFGGCAIVLAETQQAGQIAAAIETGFEKRFARKCPIFATHAAAGAGTVGD